MIKKILTPFNLVLCTVLFHFIGNVFWHNWNNIPPGWDEAAHTRGAIEFGYFFSQLSRGNFNINLFLTPFNDPYAPLVKMFGGLLIALLYPDMKLLQFVGTIFFLGSMFVLYYLGKNIYHNEWVAAIAVFIFSFFLFIYDRARMLSLDIGLLFFLLLSMLFLLKSHFFTNRKYTIMYFITLALATLTKVQAPMYFIFPFLYAVWHGRKHIKESPTITTIIMGIMVSIILILPWVLVSFTSLTLYLPVASALQTNTTDAGLLSFARWWYYIDETIHSLFTWVNVVFFIAAVVFVRKHKHKYDMPLLMYALIIYIVFTIYPNKNARFIFPMFPLLALVYAKGIYEIKNYFPNLGRSILIFLAIYNVFIYLSLSFFWPVPRDSIATIRYTAVRPYDSGVIPFEDMVFNIRNHFGDKPGQIVFIPNPEYFNINSFNMYLRLYNVNTVSAVQPMFSSFSPPQEELETVLKDYDYFYYTEGDLGLPWISALDSNTVQKDVQKYVKKMLNEGTAEKLYEYTLPNINKDKVWLVKRK